MNTTRLNAASFGLAFSVLLASSVVAQDEHRGPPPKPVRVALVEKRSLQDHRKVTGELRAVSRSRIASIEPGLVTKMPVDEGQVVEAGDVLAVLDSRRLQITLKRLEAQIRVAAARVDAREAAYEMEARDVESLAALDARGASNPKELADARSKLKMVDADREAAIRDLAVANAEADLARTRLEDMTITSPFRGVVVTTETEVGQWIGEGEAIAEVVTVGAYDAWLDVPQRYAAALLDAKAGVEITVDATGRSYGSAKPSVVPLVDPSARTFNVYRRIEDAEGELAPGMSVTGWVPTGKRGDFLTVPRNALLRNDAGFFVYVGREQPGGPATATPASIDVLFADGERVAVRGGGLAAGDAVVVEGNERLFPMMPIRYERPPVANAGRGGG